MLCHQEGHAYGINVPILINDIMLHFKEFYCYFIYYAFLFTFKKTLSKNSLVLKIETEFFEVFLYHVKLERHVIIH